MRDTIITKRRARIKTEIIVRKEKMINRKKRGQENKKEMKSMRAKDKDEKEKDRRKEKYKETVQSFESEEENK